MLSGTKKKKKVSNKDRRLIYPQHPVSEKQITYIAELEESVMPTCNCTCPISQVWDIHSTEVE